MSEREALAPTQWSPCAQNTQGCWGAASWLPDGLSPSRAGVSLGTPGRSTFWRSALPQRSFSSSTTSDYNRVQLLILHTQHSHLGASEAYAPGRQPKGSGALRICISRKLPEDAYAVGPQPWKAAGGPTGRNVVGITCLQMTKTKRCLIGVRRSSVVP